MKLPYQKVSVVGLGYIGLPTAAVLASHGVQVVGLEVKPSVVDTVNQGRVHFVEPELDAVVQAVTASGRLRATTTPEPADAFVVAVPSPLLDHGPEADLACLEAAAAAIAPVLVKGNLVILESTNAVGTTHRLSQALTAARTDLRFPNPNTPDNPAPDIHIAYCPERVLPGHVLRELVENDRIIGGLTPACAQRARDFYRVFVRGRCIITDARTAELAKLSENAYRDVNIAFANEIAHVCEQHHIDAWEVIALANRHPRVNILQPGPGVGGHCIAVDPWFIVASSPDRARLIRTAREVNDATPQRVIDRVGQLAQRFKSPTITCLGLAYKADIDDLRHSPALHITQQLAAQKTARVLAVEPHIDRLPATITGVQLVDLDQGLREADIVVLLVNHRHFADIDRAALSEKAVVDTRGLWRVHQPQADAPAQPKITIKKAPKIETAAH